MQDCLVGYCWSWPLQVCTDYLSACDRAMARSSLQLVDRQLAAAPLASSEGQDYLAAMAAAANFAFANRLAAGNVCPCSGFRLLSLSAVWCQQPMCRSHSCSPCDNCADALQLLESVRFLVALCDTTQQMLGLPVKKLVTVAPSALAHAGL